jgi:AcrR family transcriptional regulator
MNRAERPLQRHIATVAAELFYKHGIHATGVDRIAMEAAVTKRTLYRYYPSKDVLIAAALRHSPHAHFPREGDPAEQIVGAFRAVAAFLKDTSYRGCPWVVIAAELTDPKHPARHAVRERVAARKRWFADRAREAGAADPELLAEQLNLLIDGAMGHGAKAGEADLAAEAAIAAARTLLASQLQRPVGVKVRDLQLVAGRDR